MPGPGRSAPGGGAWSRGGVCSRGLVPGGCAWWRPPGTATAADGTHPTGMHSCFQLSGEINADLSIFPSVYQHSKERLFSIFLSCVSSFYDHILVL